MTAFPRWEYVRNYVTKYLVQYGEGFAYSFSILIKLISDDVLCTERKPSFTFTLSHGTIAKISNRILGFPMSHVYWYNNMH